MEKKLTIEQEFKLIRTIEKVFNDNYNEVIPKEYYAFDSCNVAMIIAKSDFGKRILLRFINPDSPKKSELDFTTKEGEIPTSRFSLEYLHKLLNIFDYDDAVRLLVKNDFPMAMENKDFKVFLAPRIDELEEKDKNGN
jgi:ABC-type ATPase with predicted acetyltransferase domain